MNILITGAGDTSFIGKNLKEKLSGQYNLFCTSHNDLDCSDLSELGKFISKNHIDIIIHSANYSVLNGNADLEYYMNMKMFLNIKKMSSHVSKILYFGSGAEYDKTNSIDQVTEDSIGAAIPTSQYGLAKYTMNEIARHSDNIYNLRLFGVFGKYENPYLKFISNLCCKAIYGFPLTIRKDCSFDYLYIDDLVQIIEWFIQNTPQYHDYNVVNGKSYRLSEIAQTVRRISGKDLSIQFLSDSLANNYTASNYRLLSETKYQIEPFEESVMKLYCYYSDHILQINKAKIKGSF